MHDCKTTKARFTEVALDGADPRSDEILFAQLRGCAACREEFGALKENLRTTRKLIDANMPAEDYWTGYHARLKEKLWEARVESIESQVLHPPTSDTRDRIGSHQSRLKSLLMTSVRVPVPVLIALVLILAVAIVLAARASQQLRSSLPVTTSLIHVPVEIRTIQERVVTKVVYRDRRVPVRKTNPNASNSSPRPNLATNTEPENKTDPVSLIGFKPLDEIKLTVIKGGYQDEK